MNGETDMAQVVYRHTMPVGEPTVVPLRAGARVVSVVDGTTAGTVELLVLQPAGPASRVQRQFLVTGSATEVPDGYDWAACSAPSWDTGDVMHAWVTWRPSR